MQAILAGSDWVLAEGLGARAARELSWSPSTQVFPAAAGWFDTEI